MCYVCQVGGGRWEGAAMRQDVRSDSLKAFFNKHPSSCSWHAFGLALSLRLDKWKPRGGRGGQGCPNCHSMPV